MQSAWTGRRRRGLAASAALGALLAAGCGESSTHRNVVLVTVDTLRADALGAYGNRLGASPHLDRLAARGVLFEQCAASAPTTLPSHASILTGVHPYRHGVRSNARHVLAAEQLTLAERLAGAGFATGAETAAIVLGRHTGIDQGFEHFRDTPTGTLAGDRTRPADEITRAGLEFVRARRGEPFFLWLHYFDPHAPYTPPTRLRERFPESRYHAEVAAVDESLGRLLRVLEEEGLAERTLVVVTADHGESLGEHGEPTHSAFVYESTIHVPLILAGPGLEPGRRVAEPVRSIDVAPTVLDWLGLPPLPDAEGASLLPLARGEPDPARRTLYGESPELHYRFGASMLRYVRDGSWKYLHKARPELYELSRDPHEAEDLVDEQPERAAALRARLAELLAGDAPAPATARELDAETARQLAALGYAVGGAAREIRDTAEPFPPGTPDPADFVDDLRDFNRGWGAIRARDGAAALEAFRALKARHPDSAEIAAGIADAQLVLGDAEAAVAALRRALELEPGSVRFRVELAELALLLGRPAEAEAVLPPALERRPCDAKALRLLASAARATRGAAAQKQLLEEGLARCDAPPELQNELAYLLASADEASLRDGPRAVQLAERAVRDLSHNPLVLDTLAAAYAEVGRWEDALRVSRRAVRAAGEQNLPRPAQETLRGHLALLEARRPIRE